MYRLSLKGLQPGPAEIEAKIRFYMGLYLKRRVWFVSQSVVGLIEALLRHPEFDATLEQRCGFVRLAKQWRCLASIDRMTMTASFEQSNGTWGSE